MKILITYIIIIAIFFADKIKPSHSIFPSRVSAQFCPEQEAFDWVAINLFLTANNLEQQREKVDISVSKTHQAELQAIAERKTNTPPRTKKEINSYWNALGSYWREHGVERVSDPKVCEFIQKKLIEVDEDIQKRYVPRAYYKIENKYLIIYKSTTPGTGRTPVRVLNEDFEIVGRFGM